MKTHLTFFLSVFFSISLLAQDSDEYAEDGSGMLKLNSEYSYLMLEHNEDLRKLDILLDARKDGLIKNENLGLGALNFLSGGNFQDNPAETHSVNDASSIGLIEGAQVAI